MAIHLTPAEMKVLELVAKGFTNAFIKELLCLSKSTVERHTYTIYEKLGVGSEHERSPRVTAVLWYLANAGDVSMLRKEAINEIPR